MRVVIRISSQFGELVPNQNASVTVLVENNSASSITLTSITPTVSPLNLGCVLGDCVIPIGLETIAAGASRYYGYGFVAFAPQDVALPQTVVYTLGATAQTATDIASAPTQAVTVGQPDLTPPSAAGFFKFDSALNSAYWPFFY